MTIKKAVLWQRNHTTRYRCKIRHVLKFLQLHRAVLHAIARHLVIIIVVQNIFLICCILCTDLYVQFVLVSFSCRQVFFECYNIMKISDSDNVLCMHRIQLISYSQIGLDLFC